MRLRFADLSGRAIYMGLLAAFVGYWASFAIVLAGLDAVGASPAQAATGLFFATLAMAVGSIWLPAATRIPAAVAWSTPGAAFLAAAHGLPSGFGEAVGAMIVCAGLIVLTGVLPPLARLVAAIPSAIANALLAGVLFRLCIAPALALGDIPLLMAPVIAAWVIGLIWHRLAAMPFAVVTFVAVLVLSGDWSGGVAVLEGGFFPRLDVVTPVFSLSAIVSISLPLYLVTMAGQNVPGFAVLSLNGYNFARGPLIAKTGFISLVTAPFGAIPVNMSAIVAAMMSGEDAGRDPERRYWAAIVNGLGLVVLALLAVPVAHFASLAPSGLITGLAGLALIGALLGALKGAFASSGSGLEAPALTFLITASGMSLFAISGAVWGLGAGLLVWLLLRMRDRGGSA